MFFRVVIQVMKMRIGKISRFFSFMATIWQVFRRFRPCLRGNGGESDDCEKFFVCQRFVAAAAAAISKILLVGGEATDKKVQSAESKRMVKAGCRWRRHRRDFRLESSGQGKHGRAIPTKIFP
jgi:hypothetical protein